MKSQDESLNPWFREKKYHFIQKSWIKTNTANIIKRQEEDLMNRVYHEPRLIHEDLIENIYETKPEAKRQKHKAQNPVHQIEKQSSVRNGTAISQVCEFEDCHTKASLNFPGFTKRRFCAKHKLDGMVDVSTKKCEYEGCFNYPGYNYDGEKIRRFCKVHRLKNMVSVTARKCEVDNCTKVASYNFGELRRKRFCQEHKLDGMIHILRTCENSSCELKPCFDYKEKSRQKSRTGRFCANHALPGMVNLRDRILCQHPGCKAKATHKHKGGKITFCALHKENGMIARSSKKRTKQKKMESMAKKCVNDCGGLALFNFDDGKQGKFCLSCKEPGMVDISDRCCMHEGCLKQFPLYNYKKMKGMWCRTHKLDGMVKCKNKQCLQGNCLKFPLYGHYGVKAGLYCFEHKLPQMVDVETGKCVRFGCKLLAEYNYDRCKGSKYCSTHKKVGMIKVKNLHEMCGHPNSIKSGHDESFCEKYQEKCCDYILCNSLPLFNFEGESHGRLCEKHKLKGMVICRKKLKVRKKILSK